MIVGKVARIMNAYEIAINRGADDGVGVGMRFVVPAAGGALPIVDPDTKDVRGDQPVAKTVVKVTTVHPRWAVAQTFRMSPGRAAFAITAITGSAPAQESIATDETTAADEVAEGLDYSVNVGDPVVQVQGEDNGGYLLPEL